VRELGSHEVAEVHSLLFGFHEQILARREGADAFPKASEEIFGIVSHGLSGDRLDERQHVLRSVVDLPEQEIDLLPPLTLRHVGNEGDDVGRLSRSILQE